MDSQSAVERMLAADKAAERQPGRFKVQTDAVKWLRNLHATLGLLERAARRHEAAEERTARGQRFDLGIDPLVDPKVYLTVQQFVAYGVVQRRTGHAKVTVEDVLAAISALGLEAHHCNGAGQPAYDPVPIRKALSTDEDGQ